MAEQEGPEAQGEEEKSLVVKDQQNVSGRVQEQADGQQDGLAPLEGGQQGAQGGHGQRGDQQGLDPGVDALDADEEREDVEEGQDQEDDACDADGFFHHAVKIANNLYFCV